jgi:hypothetical protein
MARFLGDGLLGNQTQTLAEVSPGNPFGLLQVSSIDQQPGVTYGSLLPLASDNAGNLRFDIAAGLPGEFLRSARTIAEGARGVPVSPEDAATALLNVTGGSAFGTAPAGALASGIMRRQADMPAGGAAEPSVYDVPAGSDPRYLGAAPDRTDFSFLRYRPAQGTSARVQTALNNMRDPENPVRKQMLADIDRGVELGGKDWYNTEELRDWFKGELGAEEGDRQWREFMQIIGATSPGSKVPANLGNASAVRQRLYDMTIEPGTNRTRGEIYREQLEGVENIDQAREIARGRKKGYGHKTQGLQEMVMARFLRSGFKPKPEEGPAASSSMTENPKPKGFTQSLLGSGRNIAADLHFTRYMAMASQDPSFLSGQAEIGQSLRKHLLSKNPQLKKYISGRKKDGKEQITFNAAKAVKEGNATIAQITRDENGDLVPQMFSDKPNNNEYEAFEDFMFELGNELDMTGPQIQAALWMGAADRTGVDPSSQGTFMELLRKRADLQAKKTGSTREEVMREFIRNQGLLSSGVPVQVPTGQPESREAVLERVRRENPNFM